MNDVRIVVVEEHAKFGISIDQLFIVRKLTQEFIDKNRTLYSNFTDFKQAYNNVW